MIGFIFILVLMGTFILINNRYKSVTKHPFISGKKSFELDVKSGENLNTVLSFLNKKGELESYYLIKIYIKNENLNTEIKPGTYSITTNTSLKDFIAILSKGSADKNTIKFTIPEGYNVEQIGSELEKKGIMSKEEFIASCKAFNLPEYIKSDNKRRYSLEGFLFPATYDLKKGMKGEEIISIMLKKFMSTLEDIEKKNNIHVDINQIDGIVTMSSIVEKEAKVENERKIISSVFYNRINKNMKLESCATVLYALNMYKPKLYNKDLMVKSLYNTYLSGGLPEGPICNPGRASIEAALMPANTDYIYFVSKNDGTHFFSKNYNEFLKAKNEFQGGK